MKSSEFILSNADLFKTCIDGMKRLKQAYKDEKVTYDQIDRVLDARVRPVYDRQVADFIEMQATNDRREMDADDIVRVGETINRIHGTEERMVLFAMEEFLNDLDMMGYDDEDDE